LTASIPANTLFLIHAFFIFIFYFLFFKKEDL